MIGPYRCGMLDPGARRALAATRFADVRGFAEIDSTNRHVLELARAGAPEGVVVVADHQTAGRGRLGRAWAAPPGSSLLVSVLLRPSRLWSPVSPARAHLVTAAVGLAASDACSRVAGFQPGLKWPNDLVVVRGGPPDEPVGSAAVAKLGGILAEADLGDGGSRPWALVVGLGVNLNWPLPLPDELADLADLAAAANQVAGRPVDRDEMLVSFLLALEDRYAGLSRPEGTSRLMADYRDRCVTLGRPVRVELAGSTFTGRATDVSDDGHLVVETSDGVRRQVTAGDVEHLR